MDLNRCIDGAGRLRWAALLTAGALVFTGALGCEEEADVDTVDTTATETELERDAAEAGDDLQRAAESSGEALQSLGERAGEALESGQERAGEALESAGQSLQRDADPVPAAPTTAPAGGPR